MQCPICHFDNGPNRSICEKCGARLPSESNELAAAYLSEEPPGGSNTDDAARRTEAIPASLSSLTIGHTFAGRYRITQKLGRGGMGMVYKAEDLRLARPVALKLLPPALTWDTSAKERFVHEAHAASVLDHPNICTIYEIDETADGQMFIAMAFCEGETLTKWIARGPMAIEDALEVAIGLCAGLGAAHTAGIVHRDIKPGNIMLKEGGRARIVDFGLAKLAGEARLTATGTVVGTADYMSPEQASGADVDARTDTWAIGVVLYEMLTGRVPFRGETQQAVIHSILHGRFEQVSQLRAGVPLDLSKAVERCLKRNPGDRYQSAVELQAELENIRSGTSSARAPVARRPVGSHLRLWGMLHPDLRKSVIALVVLGLGVALSAVLPPGRPVVTFQSAAPWVRLWIGPQPVPRERLLAVLPFEAGGATPDQALCDGIVAVTTSKLARVAALTDSFWVKSFGLVLSYSVNTPRQARDSLQANLALAGSVNLSGDMITLRANLFDTKTQRRLRTFTVSDPIANLSTWQEGLVQRMAGMLGEEVSARQIAVLKAGCTALPAAYVPYLRGWGYVLRSDSHVDGAIAAFGQAIAEDSSFAAAYVGMGEAYLEKSDKTKNSEWLDTAYVWARRASELNNLLPAAFDLAGRVQFKMGRLDEAGGSFARAVQLDSTNYSAYSYLGYIYLMQRAYEKAATALTAGANLRPRDFRGYGNLGSAYYNLNRLSEAKEALEKARLISPTAAGLSNLGTYYVREQRYADADTVYRQARLMDSTDYVILGNHADAFYWTPGKMDTARVMFKEAVRMAEASLAASPDDRGVLANLASYCSMIGERARAESYLDRLIRLEPSDGNVQARVAETYEQLGQRDQALAWLDKALAAGYPAGVVDTYPGWRNARSDERFRRMRERY